MTDTLAPFRRNARYAAMICTIASAGLTFWFGLNQSPYFLLALLCAGFLVACSIMSDYVVLFIVDAFNGRNWVRFGMVCAGALLVMTLNLISNLGAVGWQRDSVLSAAKVQNTRYDARQDEVKESKASLAMWEKRLKDLEAANAWAATVTAEALRAQLASANLAIEQEAARGGCKAKCLARTKERDELAARIALAEERADLTAKIEGTKRTLAKVREKADTVDRQVSAPASQAGFFASLIKADLTPSEDAQTWTDRAIAGLLAVGMVFAPMLFSLIGWRSDDRRRPAHEPAIPAPARPEGTITSPAGWRASVSTSTIHDKLAAIAAGGNRAVAA